MSKRKDLDALGSGEDYNHVSRMQYDGDRAGLLERFKAPTLTGRKACSEVLSVRVETDEFTCLCPATGQPDYATIIVEYEPADWCVESKSFKLYLMSYRNAGAFHEDITTTIGKDLVALLEPQRLRVVGRFKARGGINFHPTFTYVDTDYSGV